MANNATVRLTVHPTSEHSILACEITAYERPLRTAATCSVLPVRLRMCYLS